MSKGEKLAHREDCSVVRDSPGQTGALLMDYDGNEIRWFPSHWADEQIFAALAFANEAYGRGHEAGQHAKAWEIRRALGVP